MYIEGEDSASVNVFASTIVDGVPTLSDTFTRELPSANYTFVAVGPDGSVSGAAEPWYCDHITACGTASCFVEQRAQAFSEYCLPVDTFCEGQKKERTSSVHRTHPWFSFVFFVSKSDYSVARLIFPTRGLPGPIVANQCVPADKYLHGIDQDSGKLGQHARNADGTL